MYYRQSTDVGRQGGQPTVTNISSMAKGWLENGLVPTCTHQTEQLHVGISLSQTQHYFCFCMDGYFVIISLCNLLGEDSRCHFLEWNVQHRVTLSENLGMICVLEVSQDIWYQAHAEPYVPQLSCSLLGPGSRCSLFPSELVFSMFQYVFSLQHAGAG